MSLELVQKIVYLLWCYWKCSWLLFTALLLLGHATGLPQRSLCCVNKVYISVSKIGDHP